MSKFWNYLVNLHIGKKIYAALWFMAGGFLVSFIAIVSVYQSDIKDKKTLVAGYKFKYNVPNFGNTSSPLSVKKDIADNFKTTNAYDYYVTQKHQAPSIDDIVKIYNDCVDSSGNVIKTSDEAEHLAGANGIFDVPAGAEFSDLKVSAPIVSSKAIRANNIVAGVGMAFAVSMAAAIFTTTGVSIYLTKMKKKNGGKK